MEIVFIYNARSGLINAAFDILHKTVSPGTYSCHLCALTHNTFSEKNEWKTFLEQLPVSTSFYHKDEWEHNTGRNGDALPAVFLKDGDKIHPFITRDKLETMNLNELMTAIRQKTEELSD